MSVPDLECGFSRDLFVQWTANPKNSVILTCRPSSGCLARHLIDNPKTTSVEMVVSGEGRGGGVVREGCVWVQGGNISVVYCFLLFFFQVRRRVYLEGEELERYRQKEREEKLAKQQAEK